MTVNDYALLTDAKASMPDNKLNATTTYDTLATSLITRCSRLFDKLTKRLPGAYFVNADATLYFDAPHVNAAFNPFSERLGAGTGIRLWIGELAAAPTSVAVSTDGSVSTYTAFTATDYYPGPWNALALGRPYQWLQLDLLNGAQSTWYGFPKGVKVVGKFGYSATVPDDVKEAVLLMVIRLLRKAEQNYVDTGVLLDSGQVMQGMKLDKDINDVIYAYRRLAI